MIRILAILLLASLVGNVVLGYLWQGDRTALSASRTDAKTKADDIRTLQQANGDQTAAIHDLQAKLTAAAGREQDVQAKADEAQRTTETRTAERDKALAELQRVRGQLYATDHDAAAWAAGRIPSSLSLELRRQWDAAAGLPGNQDR